MSSKDGRMTLSTSSKKDLGVVERERASFFPRGGSFFVHASLRFQSGASESFCVFLYLFLI